MMTTRTWSLCSDLDGVGTAMITSRVMSVPSSAHPRRVANSSRSPRQADFADPLVLVHPVPEGAFIDVYVAQDRAGGGEQAVVAGRSSVTSSGSAGKPLNNASAKTATRIYLTAAVDAGWAAHALTDMVFPPPDPPAGSRSRRSRTSRSASVREPNSPAD